MGQRAMAATSYRSHVHEPDQGVVLRPDSSVGSAGQPRREENGTNIPVSGDQNLCPLHSVLNSISQISFPQQGSNNAS